MVRLAARPVGELGEVATEAFAVGHGDRVSWTVTRPIQSSVATLRVGLDGGRRD